MDCGSSETLEDTEEALAGNFGLLRMTPIDILDHGVLASVGILNPLGAGVGYGDPAAD